MIDPNATVWLEVIIFIFVFGILSFLAILPTIIAFVSDHDNKWLILIFNILFFANPIAILLMIVYLLFF